MVRIKAIVQVETEFETSVEPSEDESLKDFVLHYFDEGLKQYMKDYDPWFGDNLAIVRAEVDNDGLS